MFSVEGLHAHYGMSHVLQGVDLVAQPDRVSAVVGRNGVGKTTLLRALMGLVRPTSGRVVLDGVDIGGWPPHRVARASVAYVPEGRLVFPELTVIENIRVGERRPAREWPLPRLFELFPSLADRAGSRGATLSGGEQQMLAIARALATDPRVLLLDEPSQGLAPIMVHQLSGTIRRLGQAGVTILLVEQNLRLVEQVADSVHVMVKGRIVYAAPTGRYRTEAAEVRSRYLTV